MKSVLSLSSVTEEEIGAQRGLVTCSNPTAPRGGGRILTELRSELFKALVPLQHCLPLSPFTERETEAQEGEACVVIRSLGSRGQIHPASITLSHYPL